MKKAAKELHGVLKDGGVKNKATPSKHAEQEDSVGQETDEACPLQETLHPGPDIQLGLTPHNSQCASVEDVTPNYRPKISKIPDSLVKNITQAKEAATEMKSVIKTFPPICVIKATKTKGQKVAIKLANNSMTQ